MTPADFFLIVALIMIATEMFVMQFTVFWFMFIGIAALITSLVAWVIPDLSWGMSITVFAISCIGVSAVLYPLLKRWQDKPGPMPGNDAIGQTVEIVETISPGGKGKAEWSGAEWAAELADGEPELQAGQTGKIIQLEGVRLIVGAAD